MPLVVMDWLPPLDIGDLALGSAARVCVSIPAFNEEERIGACLAAFSRQTTREPFSILVVANNCTDRTADIVRAFAETSPIDVHLADASWPVGEAPAAVARRRSVSAAMIIAGRNGIVMTTDADTIVEPNWVEENLRGLRSGADVVCGGVTPDMTECAALPTHVLQRGAQEFGLENAQTQLECLLDDLPWDQWPHHRTESTASLACSVKYLEKVGGVPVVEPGEDKALVHLVRRAGGRIRHSPTACVTTSCRLEGRAHGGWADDLRERVENPDAPCHPSLEPSLDLFRRAALRGALRDEWPNIRIDRWAHRLRLSPQALRDCLACSEFEDAWASIEDQSPRLVRRRIAAAMIPAEYMRAMRLLKLMETVIQPFAAPRVARQLG